LKTDLPPGGRWTTTREIRQRPNIPRGGAGDGKAPILQQRMLSQQDMNRSRQPPPQPMPAGIQLHIPRYWTSDPRPDQPHQRRRLLLPCVDARLQRAEELPPPADDSEDASGAVHVHIGAEGAGTVEDEDDVVVEDDGGVSLGFEDVGVEPAEKGDQRL